MILLDFVKGRLILSFDINSPYYKDLHLIARSLLSASSKGRDSFFISYFDFLIFREKIDKLGIDEDREMTFAAKNYFEEFFANEKRKQDIKNGVHNDFVISVLEGKVKTPAYSDQITGISYLLHNRVSGLFDAMGIGKSLEFLYTIIASKDIRKTLIICPKNVILGFERQIKEHTFFKSISIPAGGEKSLNYLRENKEGDWNIGLVHPENLVSRSGKGNNIYSPVTKLLKTIPFDFICVDEWHMYKNLDASRTKCVMSILKEVRSKEGNLPKIIMMTGTPVSESPMNAYNTLKVCEMYLPDPLHFENHFTIKKAAKTWVYSKAKHKKIEVRYNKIIGYKNLSELKALIESVSIRRTKEDLKGFPDKVEVIRDVLLSGKHLELYKAACGDLRNDLKTDFVNLKDFLGSAKTLRLRQILNHPAFVEEGIDSCKYIELDNILEEIFEDPIQKVVIWTEFRTGVDLIFDRWNEKCGVMKLYGGVEVNEKLASSFESDEGPRIAACIPAKAGIGVDFLARARTAIYIERPYSFTQFQQSLDRIHRRVNTDREMSDLDKIRSQPATIMFLDVPGSMDEFVKDKLYGKTDFVDAVTTDTTKLVKMGRQDLLNYLR